MKQEYESGVRIRIWNPKKQYSKGIPKHILFTETDNIICSTSLIIHNDEIRRSMELSTITLN